MQPTRVIPCTILALLILLPPSSLAQEVLGCSIVPEEWEAVQQGLNQLSWGACGRHDRCYRACNFPGGPYLGYGYRATCDAVFFGDLLAACAAWSLILSFPNIEWVDQQDFLNDCGEFASYAYVGVTFLGENPFLNQQCDHCNRWACLQPPYRAYSELLCERFCWPGRCDLFPESPFCPQQDEPISPIALDLQGNGLKLTGPNPAVYFDLDADGTVDHTSWTRVQTKDGFLVLDRNQNGRIEDGREMFGTATPLLLSAARTSHGYEALAEFDSVALGGTEDGMIDQHDKIFEHLQLWLDKNRDAATQEGELKSLSELGVTAISLSYYRDDQEDQWGNVFKWWSPIYFEDGSTSMSTDVFFARLPE